MFDEKSYSLKMDKAIEVFSKELSSLRTGRANAAMLDLIKVDVYGQQMPINQIGSITTPEPRMINIQVWDINNVPLVDAAMKQIYEKGWMHNRLRMVVGSFLVKNLLLNWTLGERYFQETLLDYDEASNAAGWQWIAGCGADASPYFRVFNPILQSERFDPQAKFILQYLPQLQTLQKPSSIFQPHLQEQAFQSLINQSLYYEPLVDLKDSRNRALEAYQKIK